MKKNSKKLLLLVLISFTTIPSSYADYNTTKWANTLVAAGIILGGTLLLHLDDYETHSNERLCTKVEDLYDSISFTYQDEFACIASLCNPAHTDESLLYRLAGAKREKASLRRYKADIQRLKTKLTPYADELRYRLIHSDTSQLYHLQDVLSLAQMVLKKLTLLSAIVLHHHSYFELYEKENKVWQEYAKELAVLYDTSLSYYELNSDLDALIEGRTTLCWNSSPYSKYASTLHQTITTLESTLVNTSFKYRKRRAAAQQLIDKLYILEGQLIAHPFYEHELSRW